MNTAGTQAAWGRWVKKDTGQVLPPLLATHALPWLHVKPWSDILSGTQGNERALLLQSFGACCDCVVCCTAVLVKSILWQMQTFLICGWIESAWMLTEALQTLSHVSDTLCQWITGSCLLSSIAPPERAVDQLLCKWSLTSAACAGLSDAALCAFNRKWLWYLLTDKLLNRF